MRSITSFIPVLTIIVAGITLAPSSIAQSRPSFGQIREAAQRRCTFRKTEVTTWTDETGTPLESTRRYDYLDLDCTGRVFSGEIAQEVLRYDRVNVGARVVTFKGSGFTVFCRNASLESAQWFQQNAQKNQRFLVAAVYLDLQAGVFEGNDINVTKCGYYDP